MLHGSHLRQAGLPELLLGTYSDGSWATCRNGASQGRYLLFSVTPVPLLVIDWTSKKVSRDGQWCWTNTLHQVSDGLTKVQARQRLVEILCRCYHALKFDPTFEAGKKLTTEQRQQRENELHQAVEFGPSIWSCHEVLLTSDSSGSVSLRGMSMCDAGYSGRTVKIVKELREKFDLAHSDHNSPFPCSSRLLHRSTAVDLHKIYSQHAPTKLSRVDEILSKHEGHGQVLLCALICKYNLSLVSVLSVLEGKLSRSR